MADCFFAPHASDHFEKYLKTTFFEAILLAKIIFLNIKIKYGRL